MGQHLVNAIGPSDEALGRALHTAGRCFAYPGITGPRFHARRRTARRRHAATRRLERFGAVGAETVHEPLFGVAAHVEQQAAHQEVRRVRSDGLAQRSDFALERFGERRPLGRNMFLDGAGDGRAQRIEPLGLVGLNRHDRHAELTAEAIRVDADALALGHVHHVQGDDHRQTEFERLCC